MSGTAVSIDGRTFTFEIPLDEAMPIGTFVVIDVDDRSFLAQVLDEAVMEPPRASGSAGASGQRLLAGSGMLLDRGAVFGSGTVSIASDERVSTHFASSLGSTVGIELGEMQAHGGIPAQLHANGFGRHTFLCGQSGSGKTYTLGIVLERLLLDTDIRLVVFDPNSDFVNLRTMRAQGETGLGDVEYQRLRTRFDEVADKVHVFGGPGSDHQLRAWFSAMSTEQQTLVLGLDPGEQPEEYNAFVRIRQDLSGDRYTLHDVLARARSSFSDDQRRLGLRIENLGVADLSIWADHEHPGVGEVVESDWRMVVLDLGSLPSQRESSVAAAGLLGYLWDLRRLRQPTMLVIDEAHNICPRVPLSANQAMATEHLVKIAGEGRKFGLYILLSTQRPDKVNPNVLSQCDNLLLMKMNSAVDIRSLSETFSFAPHALIEQAAGFGLGEGLAAGKIAPDPVLFRSGHRVTTEGGGDVPSTWATRR